MFIARPTHSRRNRLVVPGTVFTIEVHLLTVASPNMFSRLLTLVSSSFTTRVDREHAALKRILTTAGMIESSRRGYSAADLASCVGEYIGTPVGMGTTCDDLDLLETVGVIREDDGVWTWDCIGVDRNQTVVSRLSSHLVG
ncbi:hypothetical protein [Rhodopirellula baltica]|nr:hypothetical protein [Rhodopirellula baltica]